jgi:hypothetical protein
MIGDSYGDSENGRKCRKWQKMAENGVRDDFMLVNMLPSLVFLFLQALLASVIISLSLSENVPLPIRDPSVMNIVYPVRFSLPF